MAKLRLEIELIYDADVIYGDDEDGKNWFLDSILGSFGDLHLHSNTVGDSVGAVVVLKKGDIYDEKTPEEKPKKAQSGHRSLAR
jgi:hypothetical protein